jgi:hypothetical protein
MSHTLIPAMKAALSLCLALLATASLRADIFRPQAVSGAVLQRATNHSRDRGNGAIVSRRGGYPWAASYGYHGYRSPWSGYYPGYDLRYYPYVNLGYYGGYYGTGFYTPAYYGPGYYGSTSGAVTGLTLGALAGGIIGNNSAAFHHSGANGAAWGAGIGMLLGAVADANRGYAAVQPSVVAQPAVNYGYGAPAPAQQPVTIINNYYNAPATPMSVANGLFGR